MGTFLFIFAGLVFVMFMYLYLKIDELKGVIRLNNFEIESLEYRVKELEDKVVTVAKQLKQTGEGNES